MRDITQGLDDIDRKIVEELQRDASQTSQELAQRLGMSASGIRRRVRNLKNSGAIRIIAVPNPSALDNQTWVLIGLNVKPGKAVSVARALTKFTPLYTVALSLGRYDVIALGQFGSVNEVTDFVSRELPKIGGVSRSETSTLTQPFKYHGLIW